MVDSHPSNVQAAGASTKAERRDPALLHAKQSNGYPLMPPLKRGDIDTVAHSHRRCGSRDGGQTAQR